MNNQYLMSEDEEEEAPKSQVVPPSSNPTLNLNAAPQTANDPGSPKIINQDNKQYEFNPGANGSLTVHQPPPVEEPIAAQKMHGFPVNVNPNVIADYLSKYKTDVNKYGPEEQMALEKQIQNRQNSLGYKLTDAGKGFSDALMQGVARAGNPGNQQAFEEQQNRLGQEQLGAMQKASEGNLQRVQTGMSIDRMDPKSPASKSAQESYAPLFQKLGYPASAIGGMSASNIENALALMSQYGGKEIEAQIKAYELQIEDKRLQATLANVESEAQNRKEQRAFDQTKLGAEHPFLKMLGGLGEAGGTGAPGPHGQTVKQNGKTYAWNGSSYEEQ